VDLSDLDGFTFVSFPLMNRWQITINPCLLQLATFFGNCTYKVLYVKRMEDQLMNVEYCEIKEKVIPKQPVYYVSALAMDVKIVDQMLQVFLRDGRIISIPLDWISFLSDATPNQRADVEIQAGGANLYWPETGASLSVMSLLAGSDPCSYCWYRVSHFK
jgi:hypothetical protein